MLGDDARGGVRRWRGLDRAVARDVGDGVGGRAPAVRRRPFDFRMFLDEAERRGGCIARRRDRTSPRAKRWSAPDLAGRAEGLVASAAGGQIAKHGVRPTAHPPISSR
jgi:hypothetical protein